MKASHKRKHCLNCHYPFTQQENFCPRCGQSNNDFRLSVWELLKEFFDNYLNFDSRLYRTVFPFLFMPGYLTVAFIHGRRKRYVHPIRLYLIASLIFFTVFSFTFDVDDIDFDIEQDDEIEQLLKSKYFPKKEHTVSMLDVLEKAQRSYQLPPQRADSIAQRFNKKDKEELLYLYYHFEDTSDFTDMHIMGVDYKMHDGKLWNLWIKDKGMTPDALLDSIHATDKNAFNRYFAKKALKFGKNNNSEQMLVSDIIDNIPITVFFLLPIFAFFLKVVHFRSHKLYIEHLIATFHLHAYFFLFCAVALPFTVSEEFVVTTLVTVFCIILLYIFLMFRRIYKQGWFKTAFKMWLLFSVYPIVILFFSIFEVLASIMLF